MQFVPFQQSRASDQTQGDNSHPMPSAAALFCLRYTLERIITPTDLEGGSSAAAIARAVAMSQQRYSAGVPVTVEEEFDGEEDGDDGSYDSEDSASSNGGGGSSDDEDARGEDGALNTRVVSRDDGPGATHD